MKNLLLAGVGLAVPPHTITHDDAAAKAQSFCGAGPEQRRLLPALYRRSGVAARHSVVLTSSTGDRPADQDFYPTSAGADDRGPTTAARMARYEAEAVGLAERAVRDALARAGTAAAGITHLVTASCSGFAAPGFDLGLIAAAGLPAGTARTHVGFMGCHAALNALRVARAFAAADDRACVLVCAVELCSLHHQYGWDPEQVVANALFADGAAAVVCRATDGRPAGDDRWTLVANGSVVLPDTADHMTWRIGDHGFRMTLSPKVPDVIGERLRPWLAAWLERSGLSLADVGSWAVHPGGPRILSATADALGLPADALDASRGVLARYGNMSSPTVLFIAERLREAGAARPCVMLGFGPGLVVEAALLT